MKNLAFNVALLASCLTATATGVDLVTGKTDAAIAMAILLVLNLTAVRASR